MNNYRVSGPWTYRAQRADAWLESLPAIIRYTVAVLVLTAIFGSVLAVAIATY